MGCGWDLFAFAVNLDGSGGDASTKMAAGETLFTGNAAAGSATVVYPRAPGNITAFTGVSEDGALVNYRVRDQANMQNWLGGTAFQGADAEASPIDQRIGRCNIPLDMGSQLVATLTNAAAKCDGVLLAIGKNGVHPTFKGEPFGPLPPNTFWIEISSGTTATADTWTSCTLTIPDYTFDRHKRYRILGSLCYGATMLAYRFRFKTGPDVENAPGFYAGNSDQLNTPVFFSHPPEFDGDNPPTIEVLCTAGDTAQTGMMLVQEL
jgi:hypothetical protein